MSLPTTPDPAAASIRPMTEPETATVAALWYRAGKAAYPYLPNWQAMTPALAEQVFRRHIAAGNALFVIDHAGAIVGYLALQQSYIDRLYVDPPYQGCGYGSALLEHARRLSPLGLELHTHQRNASARAFYERRGFVAVRFGISPAPESAPDVEYHWRP